MSKLILMRGLPASGKSTICQGRMLADGNTVRINKDLLRKMLHFNKFNHVNEKVTHETAKELAKVLLKKNNVIIDDTNLNPKVMSEWKALAKAENVKFEVMDLTSTTVEECCERDLGREDSVGAAVIKNMALKYGLTKFEPNSIVLCDIDGTISDPTARLHYVKEPEDEEEKKTWTKDWKSFFMEMENDPVRELTQNLLMRFHTEGKKIIFMSARPEMYKEITLRWLSKNFLTFAYTLIMRPTGDKRPDTEVKKEMFNTYFKDKSVIHAVIDDRPSIIRVWQEMGLNVLDVGNGKEF